MQRLDPPAITNWSDMHPFLRTLAASALAIIFSPELAAEQQPPSPSLASVRVLLRDERDFSAYVDQRTDDETLWLRFSRGTATLSTGFTWDLVQSVRVGSDRYTAAEFREVAAYFAAPRPTPLRRHDGGSGLPEAIPTHDSVIDRRDHDRFEVESISISASVANWDRDAEADGIELRLLPRAANGRVLVVPGAIKVELFSRNYYPARDRPPLATLGRWSQAVQTSDFADWSGAICRLPFLSPSPEQDPTVQSLGLLRVQFNVAGQGDFFAEATVRIRSYNPIRDQLREHDLHHDSFGRYRARHW